jgi:hypothetical protein
MITYLLAIASPTHAVPASIYWTGYDREGTASQYGIKHTYFGIPLTQGYVPGSPGPLFFTQYSYLGYDPRGVRDTYTLSSERPSPHGYNYASITQLCHERTAFPNLFQPRITAFLNSLVRNAG